MANHTGALSQELGRTVSTEMPSHRFPDDHWTTDLQALATRGLHRRLRRIDAAEGVHVVQDGRRMCSFASNDYLGLASHPRVAEAVRQAVASWGWGAGASRLVAGHREPHEQLERQLAAFKGTQAALVCSTGYQANLAAIRGLAGEGDAIFIDKLNHASIVDAARGSRATLRVFGHRDYDRLKTLLERSRDYRRRVIVTDSLFSMDGDFADLPRLVELKHAYDALLCIDEAHATGVFGKHGRGVAEYFGVEKEIDVTVGTLSKALGGIGGFVAGSAAFVDWLVNTAGAFIYTTALPPAACAAATAALQVVREDAPVRRRLLESAGRLRREVADVRGLDIAGSTSQIVPIIVGDAEVASRFAAALAEDGLLVPAIRPPTVPNGSARLRISLSSAHDDTDIDRLLAAIDRHLGRF